MKYDANHRPSRAYASSVTRYVTSKLRQTRIAVMEQHVARKTAHAFKSQTSEGCHQEAAIEGGEPKPEGSIGLRWRDAPDQRDELIRRGQGDDRELCELER